MGIRWLSAAVNCVRLEAVQRLCAHNLTQSCWGWGAGPCQTLQWSWVWPLGCEEQSRAEQSREVETSAFWETQDVAGWLLSWAISGLKHSEAAGAQLSTQHHRQIPIEIHKQGSYQWFTASSRSICITKHHKRLEYLRTLSGVLVSFLDVYSLGL